MISDRSRGAGADISQEEEAGTDRPDDSRHAGEVARGCGDLALLHGARRGRRQYGGKEATGRRRTEGKPGKPP